ncbi:cytochrome c oxidase subunit IV family, partial [Polychytrium aggregatum]|uniref:cytochrome c oxidase subunit IV family n=1 Tax=Polychytrium aggregatum TaxID=110093 RepID=UPI0022FE4483
ASTVSDLSIKNIETRWHKLPECEQGAIADVLAEAQKGDWKKLSLDQKRAAYFVAYGTYGPRTLPDPILKYKVATWVGSFLLLTYGLWAYYVNEYTPKLVTQTPEWQEDEKVRAIEAKQNPYYGHYAEYLKSQSK